MDQKLNGFWDASKNIAWPWYVTMLWPQWFEAPLGEGLDLTPRNIPLALTYYCAKFGRYVAMSPWVELSTENFAPLGTPSQGS